MPSNHNRLILVSAGDRSLHRHWYTYAERTYDVYVLSYGQSASDAEQHADWSTRDNSGPKWHKIASFLSEHPDLLSRHKSIWIPDDDVYMAPWDVNGLFDWFEKLHLNLAQPAMESSGYISHPILRRCPWTAIRFTNFIEVMCPLFTREALYEMLPTMTLNRSSWGLDWLWAKRLGTTPRSLGIIDATPAIHTRPLGAPNRQHMQGEGIYKEFDLTPWTDLRDICETFNIIQRPRILGGILARGGIPIPRFLANFLHRSTA